MDREFRILSVLHSVNFPVLKPLLLCEDPRIIDTEFYIMEHVEVRERGGVDSVEVMQSARVVSSRVDFVSPHRTETQQPRQLNQQPQ